MNARLQRIVLTMLLIVALPATSRAEDPDVDIEFIEWAQQVLLGPEFGGDDAEAVARWDRLPTASVIGATQEQAAVVGDVVVAINAALQGVSPRQQLKLGEPENDSASLVVIFAPLEEFAEISERHGFPYAEGNWGYFWMFWDADRTIDRAVVLLASDRLYGNELRHFAFEEITQSLGPANDSPVYADSVFYTDGENGEDGGAALTLSAEDRRLLKLLYGKLHPGDKAETVRAAAHEPEP
jgi:hypothetical protein